MYFYEGYHFWGMHLLWWFLWIALVFLVIWLPAYRRRQYRGDDPVARLKQRLAHKEITKEEYERRMERINNEVDS